MTSAISTSLSGLQTATRSLNVSAENIVSSSQSVSGSKGPGVDQINKSATSGSPVVANFNPIPDLISSLVDLKRAEISYKASAQALKVALESEKTLIDQVS